MNSGVCDETVAAGASGEDRGPGGPGGARAGADAPADVLPQGTVLSDNYGIGRLLGRGGFGATYLAMDANLQIRVAIKEFLPRLLAMRDAATLHVVPDATRADAFVKGLEQFLEEARTLAKFRNVASIISVLNFFRANGTGYMVMEYLDGEPLDQYAREAGRVGVAKALELMRPAAEALRLCHKEGLIHRDVSPENIFLTKGGQIKLLDFGAARFAVGKANRRLSVILKEGYAPFEQYQSDGKQGSWTDVYAFTATLYRLLTGQLPPTAPDRMGGTALPPLSAFGIEVPALQALIDKGMAVAAENRLQTMADVLAAMAMVPRPGGADDAGNAGTIALDDTDRLVTGDDPDAPKPGPLPARKRMLAALAVTALVLAGVGVAAVERGLFRRAADTPITTTADGAGAAGLKPGDTSVQAMEADVNAAARELLEIRLAVARIEQSGTFRDTLGSLPNRTPEDRAQIEAQEQIARDADAERQREVGEYLAKIGWLGAHDPAIVGAALTSARSRTLIPPTDPEQRHDDEALRQAIDQVAAHLRAYAEHRLDEAAVMRDVRKL